MDVRSRQAKFAFGAGALLHMTLSLGSASMAHAQPGTVQAGPQAEGPGTSGPARAELVQDLGQRRAIRGCPVGESCQGPLQASLREFELETFPKSGKNGPWVEAQSVNGHDAVRRQGRGADRVNEKGTRRDARFTGKASELRPDLPWLDELRMPDIPVHWDEKIIKYLEFYRYDDRGRNIMSAWIRDQGKYRKMMLKTLRKHDLPESLLYISMIESSYDPHEYSRVGASGLWQFMPAAGSIYGLTQTRWLDERNDPVRSTEAVAYYFKDLYDRFGDWDLAAAAFNAGYGAVIGSIAKYNSNDYWQLIKYENGLPWGTSNYVAKFLATAIVGNNLEAFGYQDVARADEVQWDEVVVQSSAALSVIAKAASAKLEDITFLNPQLRKGRTPPMIDDYRVRIPKGQATGFGERFAQLRADWDDADAYVVKHGERFEDIATTYNISRSKLRELNGLESESEVRGGMILVVPKVDASAKLTSAVEASENLYRSGVPAAEEGGRLLIPLPDLALVVKDRKRFFYRVVGGDTQGGIAAAFGVDRHELAAWNGLDPEAHLHPRMVMAVWAASDFDPSARNVAVLDENRLLLVQAGSAEHLDEAEQRIGRKRVAYSPKRPESLEAIGKKYGLGKYDLARINQRAPDTIISPDESILVYEVVDPTQSSRAADQAKSAHRNKGR